MIEILSWILQSFWVFVGSTFIIWMILYMLVVIPVEALHKTHRNSCISRLNDHKMKIEELKNAKRTS